MTALWVQGDAGAGKSRLFFEFKKYCQMHMIPFFEGNCSQHIQKQFGPLLPILNELLLCADDAIISTYGSIMKKVVPDHERLKGYTATASLDPQAEHRLLVQTVTECIIACTARHSRACVVYLNDMQWCDQGTIEVVSAFLKIVNQQYRREHSYPSCTYLYMSSRMEGVEQLSDNITENQCEQMRLLPFDERVVQEYIEAVFGEQAIGPRLKDSVAAINTKVGGNPFFLQELIKSFITHGCICRTLQWWELTTDIDAITIPVALKDLVVSRLSAAGLSDAQKQLIQIIAVLNRPVMLNELIKLASVTMSLLHDLER